MNQNHRQIISAKSKPENERLIKLMERSEGLEVNLDNSSRQITVRHQVSSSLWEITVPDAETQRGRREEDSEAEEDERRKRESGKLVIWFLTSNERFNFATRLCNYYYFTSNYTLDMLTLASQCSM